MGGILYVVSGNAYHAEALASADSSLRFNRVPHMIFSDCDRRSSATKPGVLDIGRHESFGDPFADKIRNLANSPFENTIFLDSDTYVTSDLTHLFAILERFDMAAAFAPGYRSRDDPEVPSSFYEFNTGVIVWRDTNATRDFLDDWMHTYLQLTRERPFPTIDFKHGGYEQPAFRRCAWRHDLKICVLGPEYNYRPRRPGSAVDPIRVIHARYPDYGRVEAILNGQCGPRSFQAIPGGSQEPIVG